MTRRPRDAETIAELSVATAAKVRMTAPLIRLRLAAVLRILPAQGGLC